MDTAETLAFIRRDLVTYRAAIVRASAPFTSEGMQGWTKGALCATDHAIEAIDNIVAYARIEDLISATEAL